MGFEKKFYIQEDVDIITNSELTDQFDNKKENEIKEDLVHSLDIIRETSLFEKKFLDDAIFVIFGKKNIYKFEDGSVIEVSKDQFNEESFVQGKRTDFVGILPKDEFEVHMQNAINQKIVLETCFFDGTLTYDEFITHEMAHNLFDKIYIQRYGNYKQNNNKTDVSDEYKEKIKVVVSDLIKAKYPNLDIAKFVFNRLQITEIFAMLFEREFCRRSNSNVVVHEHAEQVVKNFSEDPIGVLNKINEKNERNFTMEDSVYLKKHILSFIVSPLLEIKYPIWEDRINIF
jgi:hypothetical protein